MTQEQIKEKEMFMSMIKAINEFKTLKGDGKFNTYNDVHFVSEKLNMLDPVVKKDVEDAIKRNKRTVDVEQFARVQELDLENLPFIPLPDLDENDEIFKLKPRHGTNR